MQEKLTFEELYNAYILCLKNKKQKNGTFNFVNENLCQNLFILLEELNNRTYEPKASNCYVVTEPAFREIYAAQFGDRIVQHFYLNEIDNLLEDILVDGCCSCRKNKGTEYALKKLNKYLLETSKNGKEDCYFLKIDLSGYFMSIDRKQICKKFENLIIQNYHGKHKSLLLYLTPLIFENNPAKNCKYKCNEMLRKKVPQRRKMNPTSEYGMAIGNLTSQAASNLNLCEFDNYVINTLGLEKYIRYVDDIVIVCNDRKKLINNLAFINKKLEETHQSMSEKKTKIDTAYHGVPFLGKVSYPYGYQKANKQVIIRLYEKAKNIKYENNNNLISKTNAQIGFLKNYNCRKIIMNYAELLPNDVKQIINFNNDNFRFECKIQTKCN